MGCFTPWRFRAKLISHADSDRFSDSGLCSNAQPHPYRDSERSDTYQSQSYSEPHSDSRDSDPNATGLSGAECFADANAGTRVG